MARSYSLLCRTCGVLLLLGGVGFVLSSFRALAPGAESVTPFPMGPNGLYFFAFTGCALVGWGGALFAAPAGAAGRRLGTTTALALALMALYRMAVWVMGDVWWLGELPRIEAALFLLIALAFVWLRPARASSEAS